MERRHLTLEHDIVGVGNILFALFCQGTTRQQGNNTEEKKGKKSKQISLAELHPGVNPQMVDVIQSCWNAVATGRSPTIAELQYKLNLQFVGSILNCRLFTNFWVSRYGSGVRSPRWRIFSPDFEKEFGVALDPAFFPSLMG